MKNRIFHFLLFFFILFNFLGCVPLIVGGAVGVIGGYVVSKDTIQGDTDTQYDVLWNAAIKVCRIRGTIQVENRELGEIELKADKSLVKIKLLRMTRATTRIRVSARKAGFPNLTLAQEIYTKIIEEVR